MGAPSVEATIVTDGDLDREDAHDPERDPLRDVSV